MPYFAVLISLHFSLLPPPPPSPARTQNGSVTCYLILTCPVYYKSVKGTAIPVRWMAPEALEERRYISLQHDFALFTRRGA